MSKGRDPYIDALAEAINELFAAGIDDPNLTQIARQYFGEDKIIPQSLKGDIRQKLGRVRAVLTLDGHHVCPLSETYYRRFRKPGSIKSRAEARQCLATGSGKTQMGLLRLTGLSEHDLIWREWTALRSNQSAGGLAKARREWETACEAGMISPDHANEGFDPALLRAFGRPEITGIFRHELPAAEAS